MADDTSLGTSEVRSMESLAQLVSPWTELAGLEIQQGLTIRPVVGDELLASFVQIAPGVIAPEHTHQEEQLIVMLEGELEVTVGGDVHQMHAGDALLIPSLVPHSARTGAHPAVELDVFSPPRQAILDLLASVREPA